MVLSVKTVDCLLIWLALGVGVLGIVVMFRAFTGLCSLKNPTLPVCCTCEVGCCNITPERRFCTGAILEFAKRTLELFAMALL